MAVLISGTLFLGGVALSLVVLRVLRSVSPASIRWMRPWIYVSTAACAVVAVLFIASTISQIGIAAILFGFGIPLIVWSISVMGILWTNIAHQVAERELDRRLTSDPEMANRFYSSRWLKWLLPRRRR